MPISEINLSIYPDIKVSDGELLATKKVSSDIKETLKSQNITDLEESSDKANIATVTSITGRFPAFDYLSHKGICYLRFKKEVIFAKSKQGKVYILPSDEPRIKFIISPHVVGKDLVTSVKDCLENMAVQEDDTSSVELLVPAFRFALQPQDLYRGRKVESEEAVQYVKTSH